MQAYQGPWIFWPFWLVWQVVIGIIAFTGRLLGAVLGLLLVVAGIILTLTLVGACIGIPLAALGALMMVKSIF